MSEENQVEVEITAGTVTTSQYGTMKTGDKLRTSPEFARHLVEEAGAAKYTRQPRKAGAGGEQGQQAGEQTTQQPAGQNEQQAESSDEQGGTNARRRK
jgi:hypothetical protein